MSSWTTNGSARVSPTAILSPKATFAAIQSMWKQEINVPEIIYGNKHMKPLRNGLLYVQT